MATVSAPTKEELNELSYRGIVAYAYRCAQRVCPLNLRWTNAPDKLLLLTSALASLETFLASRPNLPKEVDGRFEAALENLAFEADVEAAYAVVYALRSAVYAALAIDEADSTRARGNCVNLARLAAEVSIYAAAEEASQENAETTQAYAEAYDRACRVTRQDFERLKLLCGGPPDGLGEVIPVRDENLMSPLWGGAAPTWFDSGREQLDTLLAQQ